MNKFLNVVLAALTLSACTQAINVINRAHAATTVTEPVIVACTTDMDCQLKNPGVEF